MSSNHAPQIEFLLEYAGAKNFTVSLFLEIFRLCLLLMGRAFQRNDTGWSLHQKTDSKLNFASQGTKTCTSQKHTTLLSMMDSKLIIKGFIY